MDKKKRVVFDGIIELTDQGYFKVYPNQNYDQETLQEALDSVIKETHEYKRIEISAHSEEPSYGDLVDFLIALRDSDKDFEQRIFDVIREALAEIRDITYTPKDVLMFEVEVPITMDRGEMVVETLESTLGCTVHLTDKGVRPIAVLRKEGVDGDEN